MTTTSFESLLASLCPGRLGEVRGASRADVDRLEKSTGLTLPGFYRFFLEKMGKDLGPFTQATTDMKLGRVIAAYEDAEVELESRYLLVGLSTDPLLPLHAYLDLEYYADDDARVVRRPAASGPSHAQFDSLEELLSWGFVLEHDVQSRRAWYRVVVEHQEHAIGALHALAAGLGMVGVATTGEHCAVYRSDSLSFVGTSTIGRSYSRRAAAVRVGADNESLIRQFLGWLTTDHEARVQVRERAAR